MTQNDHNLVLAANPLERDSFALNKAHASQERVIRAESAAATAFSANAATLKAEPLEGVALSPLDLIRMGLGANRPG